MDEDGCLCLLIDVEEIPTDPIHPDLRGLRVRTKSLSFGRFITVMAEPSCERVFGAVCADIIIAIVDQHRQPAKAVASVIKAWASLWKPATTLMSATAQIGLFGELLSLQKILMPVVGPSAGVAVCAPVHDALLIEAPADAIEDAVRTTQLIMAQASRDVLDGFEIGTDVKIIRDGERFGDKRGTDLWNRVVAFLERRSVHVA